MSAQNYKQRIPDPDTAEDLSDLLLVAEAHAHLSTNSMMVKHFIRCTQRLIQQDKVNKARNSSKTVVEVVHS